jgi:hypothetical protein
VTHEESSGAARLRQEDADFSGTRLHSPNFENAVITDGWFTGADFSGYVEGMRVNGVEVAPLIQAELDREFPQRVLLRANDPAHIDEAWTMLEDAWEATISRARKLPESWLYERVDEEWSFVETLRHLIMATDCWLRRMVKGEPYPYHAWGVAGSWLSDPASLGLDPSATPTFEEVLVVRQERVLEVRTIISSLSTNELARICVPPATPGHPQAPHTVLHCIHVILDEEWEHNRYANRDFSALAEPQP